MEKSTQRNGWNLGQLLVLYFIMFFSRLSIHGFIPFQSRPRLGAAVGKKPASSMASVVGKVDLHPSEDEEDEGYDPYHPSVGNVASTVKVSERK